MANAGYAGLTVDQLVNMRIHGVRLRKRTSEVKVTVGRSEIRIAAGAPPPSPPPGVPEPGFNLLSR
jgi:hypothetical protein